MNKKLVICGILILAGLGWFWTQRQAKSTQAGGVNQSDQSSVAAEDSAAKNSQLSSKKKNPVKATTSPSQGTPTSAARPVKSNLNLDQFPMLYSKIGKMKLIKQKPLLSKAEKQEFSQLFDAESIELAKNYLMLPEGNINNEANFQHQAAVDFLTEATKLNNPQGAKAVMEILADGQIDQKSVAQPKRLLMAKDKAELMFNLVAINKDIDSQLKSTKLSPTTQSIYQRVLSEYRKNSIVSQREVASHNKKIRK